MGCVSRILPGYTRAERRGIGVPSGFANSITGAAEKQNYGPAFYAAWAQSRKAYQKAHRRRSTPDSPEPLRRPSSPMPPKRQQRDERAVPKTPPESLPEWLSNVHLTAGGEQWYRPDLFRSEDPTQDDGNSLEKTSPEVPTNVAKKPENARDGEGQPQPKTMTFDRIPARGLKDMHEGRKGAHGDEVQSQTHTGSFIKTPPKGPKKMLDGISRNDPQNIWWSMNPVLLAPAKAKVPDASTLECGDNGIKPPTGPRASTRAHIAADPKPGKPADNKFDKPGRSNEVGSLWKLVSNKKLSVTPEEEGYTDFEQEQKYVAAAQAQTQESFRDTPTLSSRLSTHYGKSRTPEDESRKDRRRDRSDHYGVNRRRSGFADSDSYTPLRV
jgi:hypothetical protein